MSSEPLSPTSLALELKHREYLGKLRVPSQEEIEQIASVQEQKEREHAAAALIQVSIRSTGWS
jgi:hypothetical protein